MKKSMWPLLLLVAAAAWFFLKRPVAAKAPVTTANSSDTALQANALAHTAIDAGVKEAGSLIGSLLG